MAHALVTAGHRVSVIARAVDQQSVADDNGVEVHRVLPGPDWSRMRVLWRLNGYWPGFAWAAMRRLTSIHHRTPVNIVEAPECRADGFFLLRLPGRPRIVTRLHTAWIFVDRQNGIVPDLRKRFVYWQEKQCIRLADAVTAPSAAMVELTRSWLRLTEERVSVLANPLNTRSFSPNGSDRTREIVFVARLERRKGIATVARIVPELLKRYPGHDVLFRFLGADTIDCTGRFWREQILTSVPDAERTRVQFEQLARPDLTGRYRKAYVCVLPSLWENFPYALLEAMACGTPVVATTVGGLPELIDHGGSGLLVPPDDPEALTTALCTLLDDPALRDEMGRNARQRVENRFSTERVLPEMLRVYRGVVQTL
jgi:glycosyltransferase involved in cell wall biosynthesis